MVLVVDIGNTNIVCGIYKQDILIWHIRLKTDIHRTADEYYALIATLAENNSNIHQVSKIAIASVVPEMTRVWQHLFRKHYQIEPSLLNGYSTIGLKYNVTDPGFIGADLIANAFGAWKKYNSNAIIIDLGTATTIQLVTNNGDFKGVIIAPGIKTGARNLFEKAALISEIELTQPLHTLGLNTRDAVISGVINGHALMLNGFINCIKAENEDLVSILTIITGGISDLIYPLVSAIDIIDKTLTLDGIYYSTKNNES